MIFSFQFRLSRRIRALDALPITKPSLPPTLKSCCVQKLLPLPHLKAHSTYNFKRGETLLPTASSVMSIIPHRQVQRNFLSYPTRLSLRPMRYLYHLPFISMSELSILQGHRTSLLRSSMPMALITGVKPGAFFEATLHQNGFSLTTITMIFGMIHLISLL